MLLGCIADDFTGASDLANTLAKGGMATIQFNGAPSGEAPDDCEAGVVALKTRSIAPADAVARSLEALAWLKRQGCRQFVFKYCSTFDSTPEGNIGPVAEALLDALAEPIAIVCPVFPATGRTLFMGHLFVKDRLLSESGMEKHPLNPMTDPDIRRWLRRQTRGDVGHVAYPTVREGVEEIRRAFDAEIGGGSRLVVIDATGEQDLFTIGKAVSRHRLVTGGSGIAIGLPGNFRAEGLLANAPVSLTPVAGPGVVLSGSCSTTSVAQVAAYLQNHPGMAVEPEMLMSGDLTATKAFDFAVDQLAKSPIIYSSAEPEAVAAAQSRYGRDRLAGTIESFFGDLATRLVEVGVSRLVVGGGETSGAVVTALRIRSLRIGPEIDPGVPVLAADEPKAIRLALKSGNFGARDFYDKALCRLEGS
jgi:uncharacterized protein YgbK (DUF1537 family)